MILTAGNIKDGLEVKDNTGKTFVLHYNKRLGWLIYNVHGGSPLLPNEYRNYEINMKTLKLTVTLCFGSTYTDTASGVRYADKRIIMAGCESDLGHRMDCARLLVFSSDAVENLERYKEEFVCDLKSRVYDDVEDLQINFIDKLNHDLSQLNMV